MTTRTREVFCGRDRELHVLTHAYDRVAHGPERGPQLVALVADAGLGKTRIVQEFYRWLATHEQAADGTGYWPPELAVLDDNLSVEVTPDACTPDVPVPFLWWGIRLEDPGARNRSTAGRLVTAVDTLTPHLEPVYRTRRMRERRKALGVAVGKGAFDVAIDLVPFASLFKTLGETALEAGQQARALWRGDGAHVPGSLHAQQHDDLVSRIVTDLGVLLAGHGTDGHIVPAVVVVDDVQFSASDRSVVALVDALMEAAIAGRWPVLFVLTSWTAEWNQDHTDGVDAAGTVAGVAYRHREAFGPGWAPVMLAPIADLSPLVAATLPGLTPPQVEALVAQAGGNPHYLHEILRWCERNPKLFEGRTLDGALTARGLETLLEKTVDLHDLVHERLQALEPDVRRAVLLASLQGQEFLTPLVEDVVRHLEAADLDADRALAQAEHPHAFIRRQHGVGAFAQRLFHDVALRDVGNAFDEDEVEDALRQVVRQRIDAIAVLYDAPVATQMRTCLLTSRLLADASDVTDRVRVVMALLRLLSVCEQHLDYRTARGFGEQLAARLLDEDPGTFPLGWYPWYRAADALCQEGRHSDARALLVRIMPVQRARAAAAPDDDEEQAGLAMLLKTSGEAHRRDGEMAEAAAAHLEALAITRARVGAANVPAWARRDLEMSCLLVSRLLRDCGDLDGAARHADEALHLAEELAQSGTSEWARQDLASAYITAGDVALARGDRATAHVRFAAALDIRRALCAADPSYEARDGLVVALERMAGLARDARDPGAASLFDECLTQWRRLADESDSVRAWLGVANTLRSVGDVACVREDWPAAVEAYRESGRVAELVWERQPSAQAHRVRSLALQRVGSLLRSAWQLDAAEEVFDARLTGDRAHAETVRTPEAWREVAVSMHALGLIARDRKAWDKADGWFREAHEILHDIVAYVQTPASREDLQMVLRDLAGVARQRGDEEAAAAWEAEAMRA